MQLAFLLMNHVRIFGELVVCLEDDGQFIYHANKIVEGIHFNGVPVLLYEKGINTVQCEDTYIEVTETFKAYQTLIDSRQSKQIQLQQTKDGGAVTYGDDIIIELSRIHKPEALGSIRCSGEEEGRMEFETVLDQYSKEWEDIITRDKL